MKDSPFKALGKRVIVLVWSVELWLRRILSPRWRGRFWEVVGECNACGCCCVEPTIHASPVIWHFPLVRRVFVAYQRQVNGFELVGEDPECQDLIFRCTHYDAATKRCDSYATRPSMCRDYPRALLDQAWPELFELCGYRVRARRAEGLRAGVEATALSVEAKAELRRKLRLE